MMKKQKVIEMKKNKYSSINTSRIKNGVEFWSKIYYNLIITYTSVKNKAFID